MPTRPLVVLFLLAGGALLALGVARDAWWTIVGGVTALAAAAWLSTTPVPRP